MNNTTMEFNQEEIETMKQILMFIQMDENPLDEETLNSIYEKFGI
jgi:hypothetical protein